MFGSSTTRSWRTRFRALFGKGPGIPREEVERLLYEADFSSAWVRRLADALEKHKVTSADEMQIVLRAEVVSALSAFPSSEREIPEPGALLLLGVNGAGKTTLAAKLAKYYRDRGRRVVLAAGDTFRAGAVDQLKIWADRVGVPVVAQKSGADPTAVVYDAWQAAVSDNAIMIADTAGRLHTKAPLVEELKKLARVLGKDGRGAPHEAFLVLDGTTGQNALAQSKEFTKAVPITGLVVTKLDGTAKGGAALSAALELQVPIRFLGVGEKVDDLRSFEPNEFAKELFST